MRADKVGRFQVAVTSPAIVIRKPGFISERVLVSRDMDVRITLRHIEPVSKCPVEVPHVKTKDANDIDYIATWTYIETKDGPKGIISGRGPLYSFGAPSDSNVWTSVEYFEVMYEDGVVDARGHIGHDNYWRSQTIFGAAAQYYKMDRTSAEILDCIMDRNRLKRP